MEPKETAVARKRLGKYVSAAMTPPANAKKKLLGRCIDTQAAGRDHKEIYLFKKKSLPIDIK
jgi:hypothetical protein